MKQLLTVGFLFFSQFAFSSGKTLSSDTFDVSTLRCVSNEVKITFSKVKIPKKHKRFFADRTAMLELQFQLPSGEIIEEAKFRYDDEWGEGKWINDSVRKTSLERDGATKTVYFVSLDYTEWDTGDRWSLENFEFILETTDNINYHGYITLLEERAVAAAFEVAPDKLHTALFEISCVKK